MFLKRRRHSPHTKGRVSLPRCKCFSSCGNFQQNLLPATASDVRKLGFSSWRLKHLLKKWRLGGTVRGCVAPSQPCPYALMWLLSPHHTPLRLLRNHVSWCWTLYTTGWNTVRESRRVSHLFPPEAWGEATQCAHMGILPEVLGLELQTHFGWPPWSVICSLTDAALLPAVQGLPSTWDTCPAPP